MRVGGRWENNRCCKRFPARRRKQQAGGLCHQKTECRCAWLATQLRFELLHRFKAASANGRMLGILANVRFPMPAAFALCTIGV
jgi:hypothetical protein